MFTACLVNNYGGHVSSHSQLTRRIHSKTVLDPKRHHWVDFNLSYQTLVLIQHCYKQEVKVTQDKPIAISYKLVLPSYCTFLHFQVMNTIVTWQLESPKSTLIYYSEKAEVSRLSQSVDEKEYNYKQQSSWFIGQHLPQHTLKKEMIFRSVLQLW